MHDKRHYHGPDAVTEFGRLSLAFDRCDISGLSPQMLARYDYMSNELMDIARSIKDPQKIRFATEKFLAVDRAISRHTLVDP